VGLTLRFQCPVVNTDKRMWGNLEGKGLVVTEGIEEHEDDHCIGADVQVVFSGVECGSNIRISLKSVQRCSMSIPCHHANSTVDLNASQGKIA
jgi:hypothetical protein